MRAIAVVAAAFARAQLLQFKSKQQSTATGNDGNGCDNSEQQQQWHHQYSGEGAAKV